MVHGELTRPIVPPEHVTPMGHDTRGQGRWLVVDGGQLDELVTGGLLVDVWSHQHTEHVVHGGVLIPP